MGLPPSLPSKPRAPRRRRLRSDQVRDGPLRPRAGIHGKCRRRSLTSLGRLPRMSARPSYCPSQVACTHPPACLERWSSHRHAMQKKAMLSDHLHACYQCFSLENDMKTFCKGNTDVFHEGQQQQKAAQDTVQEEEARFPWDVSRRPSPASSPTPYHSSYSRPRSRPWWRTISS